MTSKGEEYKIAPPRSAGKNPAGDDGGGGGGNYTALQSIIRGQSDPLDALLRQKMTDGFQATTGGNLKNVTPLPASFFDDFASSSDDDDEETQRKQQPWLPRETAPPVRPTAAEFSARIEAVLTGAAGEASAQARTRGARLALALTERMGFDTYSTNVLNDEFRAMIDELAPGLEPLWRTHAEAYVAAWHAGQSNFDSAIRQYMDANDAVKAEQRQEFYKRLFQDPECHVIEDHKPLYLAALRAVASYTRNVTEPLRTFLALLEVAAAVKGVDLRNMSAADKTAFGETAPEPESSNPEEDAFEGEVELAYQTIMAPLGLFDSYVLPDHLTAKHLNEEELRLCQANIMADIALRSAYDSAMGAGIGYPAPSGAPEDSVLHGLQGRGTTLREFIRSWEERKEVSAEDAGRVIMSQGRLKGSHAQRERDRAEKARRDALLGKGSSSSNSTTATPIDVATAGTSDIWANFKEQMRAGMMLNGEKVQAPGVLSSMMEGIWQELNDEDPNAASVMAAKHLKKQYKYATTQTTRTYLQDMMVRLKESCREITNDAPARTQGPRGTTPIVRDAFEMITNLAESAASDEADRLVAENPRIRLAIKRHLRAHAEGRRRVIIKGVASVLGEEAEAHRRYSSNDAGEEATRQRETTLQRVLKRPRDLSELAREAAEDEKADEMFVDDDDDDEGSEALDTTPLAEPNTKRGRTEPTSDGPLVHSSDPLWCGPRYNTGESRTTVRRGSPINKSTPYKVPLVDLKPRRSTRTAAAEDEPIEGDEKKGTATTTKKTPRGRTRAAADDDDDDDAADGGDSPEAPRVRRRGRSAKRVVSEEDEDDEKTPKTPRGRRRTSSITAPTLKEAAKERAEDAALEARDERVKAVEKSLGWAAVAIGGVTCCALAVIVGMGYAGTLNASLGAISRADKAFGVLTDATRQTFATLQAYENKLIDLDKRITNAIKSNDLVNTLEANIVTARHAQRVVREAIVTVERQKVTMGSAYEKWSNYALMFQHLRAMTGQHFENLLQLTTTNSDEGGRRDATYDSAKTIASMQAYVSEIFKNGGDTCNSATAAVYADAWQLNYVLAEAQQMSLASSPSLVTAPTEPTETQVTNTIHATDHVIREASALGASIRIDTGYETLELPSAPLDERCAVNVQAYIRTHNAQFASPQAALERFLVQQEATWRALEIDGVKNAVEVLFGAAADNHASTLDILSERAQKDANYRIKAATTFLEKQKTEIAFLSQELQGAKGEVRDFCSELVAALRDESGIIEDACKKGNEELSRVIFDYQKLQLTALSNDLQHLMQFGDARSRGQQQTDINSLYADVSGSDPAGAAAVIATVETRAYWCDTALCGLLSNIVYGTWNFVSAPYQLAKQLYSKVGQRWQFLSLVALPTQKEFDEIRAWDPSTTGTPSWIQNNTSLYHLNGRSIGSFEVGKAENYTLAPIEDYVKKSGIDPKDIPKMLELKVRWLTAGYSLAIVRQKMDSDFAAFSRDMMRNFESYGSKATFILDSGLFILKTTQTLRFYANALGRIGEVGAIASATGINWMCSTHFTLDEIRQGSTGAAAALELPAASKSGRKTRASSFVHVAGKKHTGALDDAMNAALHSKSYRIGRLLIKFFDNLRAFFAAVVEKLNYIWAPLSDISLIALKRERLAELTKMGELNATLEAEMKSLEKELDSFKSEKPYRFKLIGVVHLIGSLHHIVGWLTAPIVRGEGENDTTWERAWRSAVIYGPPVVTAGLMAYSMTNMPLVEWGASWIGLQSLVAAVPILAAGGAGYLTLKIVQTLRSWLGDRLTMLIVNGAVLISGGILMYKLGVAVVALNTVWGWTMDIGSRLAFDIAMQLGTPLLVRMTSAALIDRLFTPSALIAKVDADIAEKKELHKWNDAYANDMKKVELENALKEEQKKWTTQRAFMFMGSHLVADILGYWMVGAIAARIESRAFVGGYEDANSRLDKAIKRAANAGNSVSNMMFGRTNVSYSNQTQTPGTASSSMLAFLDLPVNEENFTSIGNAFRGDAQRERSERIRGVIFALKMLFETVSKKQ